MVTLFRPNTGVRRIGVLVALLLAPILFVPPAVAASAGAPVPTATDERAPTATVSGVDPVALHGTVRTSAGAPASGTATVRTRPRDGSRPWTALSTIPVRNGAYRYEFVPCSLNEYLVRYNGTSAFAPSTSYVVYLRPLRLPYRLSMSAGSVMRNSPLAVKGTLTADQGGSVAGRTITISRLIPHTSERYEDIGTVVTRSDGTWTYRSEPIERPGVLRARFISPGNLKVAADVHTPYSVRFLTSFRISVDDDGIGTYSGTYDPAFTRGRIVELRRTLGGPHALIARTHLDDSGTFSLTFDLGGNTANEIRLLAPSWHGTANLAQPTVRIAVGQTIEG